MRQISLRTFRIHGSKALPRVPGTETILLAGQGGPEFFLVPVVGDTITQERELRRAMAKASLRASWAAAEAAGWDTWDDAAITGEVAKARRRTRPRGRTSH